VHRLPHGGRLQEQPIVPGVSIPPFLALPDGVNATTISAGPGALAALDATHLVPDPKGSVLLVPGFTGSKEDFITVLAPLAARGLRAVAIDLPGQYESSASGHEMTLAGFAAAVRSAAEALPRPLVLTGHSFGGLVVREAVLSNPLAADGVALVASGPASIPEHQQDLLRRLTEVLGARGLEAVWAAKQTMDAATGQRMPSPEITEFLTRRFLANDPRSLVAMIDVLCTARDQTDLLAAVAPPSVVLVGDLDDVWPVEQQREMAGRMGAELVEFPGAGHSPAVDEPEGVAEAIASLLARHAGGP
jgi:pimeloyl-ACP methyl ester carboxylesterase